jgi:serine protease
MPATLRIVATLLCALIAGPLLAQTSEHARVIVKYRNAMVRGQSVRDAQPDQGQRTRTLANRHNLPLEAGTTIADRTSVVQASGISSADLASRLAADPDVELAVVDERRHAHAAPNDPLYPSGITYTSPAAGQWYLHAPSALLRSPIDIEAAWSLTHGSSSIVVAMLDSGVRYDHPDLAGKLLPGRDFVSNAEIANDGDGWDDDPSDPGDWVTSAESAKTGGTFSGCDVGDSTWHGTQTAGLVGAMTNNGVGMAGTGRNVMVLPVRVLGKCGGYDSDIIAAMRWAAGLTVLDSQGTALPVNQNPAQVINLSLGSPTACNTALYGPVISELTSRRIEIVVSAGNDGQAAHAPGNCSGVINVSSLNHTGTKASYASLGPTVALSTPGGDDIMVNGTYQYPLLSTSNSGVQQPGASVYTRGGSDATIGTSFSAPLVSGTIGLMLSVNPKLSVAQVRSLLQRTSRSFSTAVTTSSVATCSSSTTTAQSECKCTSTTCGAGMLDAGAVVTATALPTPVAAISSSSSVPSGSEISLDGAGSTTGPSREITAWTWSILSGADIAHIVNGATADQATLVFTGNGTVTVRLMVKDSVSALHWVDQSFTASTGGGALDPRWLAGMALAVLALARRRKWSGG